MTLVGWLVFSSLDSVVTSIEMYAAYYGGTPVPGDPMPSVGMPHAKAAES